MQDCERPSLERQLFSNQLWETVAFVAKAAFMLGLTPWMIRVWGAQGYGEFALASSAFVLLSLVDLGIRAKTRLALCSAGEKYRAEWPNILGQGAVTFSAIGTLAICFAVVLTMAGVEQSIFRISTANRNLLLITTAMSILVMLSGLLLEPLVALGHIGKLKLATAIGWLIAIPAVAVVLSTKGSVIAALVLWLGCLSGANLVMLFRSRSVLGSANEFRPQFRLSKLAGTLREGFWFNICNATWTIKTYGTTLLISALDGPAVAGVFFILLRLSEIISALGAISSDVLFGELAQVSAVRERGRAFYSSYSWAVTLCCHIALIIGFCARDFFRIWLHSVLPMSIFFGTTVVALGLASAFNRTAAYAAMALGLAKTAARWGTIEAIGFFLAIIVTARRFELIAQLSFAVLSAIALFPLAAAISRKLMMSPGRTWLHPLLGVAPFLAVSALVQLAGRSVTQSSGIVVAVAMSGLVAIANFLYRRRKLRLMTCVTPRDRNGETDLLFPAEVNAESLTT